MSIHPDRLLRFAVAVAATALLAFAISAHGQESPLPCAHVRLHREAWETAHQDSLTSRSPTPAEGLASDLVRCRLLVGVTRARLRALLGRPDETSEASGPRSRGTDWLYQLDLNRGILSPPYYLRLVFGPRGAVSRAEVLRPGDL